MMDLMTGKMRCKSGWITVDHVTYTQKKAGNYLDEGIAVIPADGVNRLLFLEMSYMENLTFLLDRKLKKSLIPGKIYKSIHSESVSYTHLDVYKRQTFTFAYLIAERESTTWEKPAIPVAKVRRTSVSMRAISAAS